VSASITASPTQETARRAAIDGAPLESAYVSDTRDVETRPSR
jgi:hypothetical protein